MKKIDLVINFWIYTKFFSFWRKFLLKMFFPEVIPFNLNLVGGTLYENKSMIIWSWNRRSCQARINEQPSQSGDFYPNQDIGKFSMFWKKSNFTRSLIVFVFQSMPCNLISSCFFLESPWFREQDCSQPSADWQSNNNQIDGLAVADQPGQGGMGSTAPHIENPAVDHIKVMKTCRAYLPSCHVCSLSSSSC